MASAHETIFVDRSDRYVYVRHRFLRDFSRPTDIGQYQTVLIFHRHLNRLKSGRVRRA